MAHGKAQGAVRGVWTPWGSLVARRAGIEPNRVALPTRGGRIGGVGCLGDWPIAGMVLRPKEWRGLPERWRGAPGREFPEAWMGSTGAWRGLRCAVSDWPKVLRRPVGARRRPAVSSPLVQACGAQMPGLGMRRPSRGCDWLPRHGGKYVAAVARLPLRSEESMRSAR